MDVAELPVGLVLRLLGLLVCQSPLRLVVWHLIILLIHNKWSSITLYLSILTLHLYLNCLLRHLSMVNSRTILHLSVMKHLLHGLVLNMTFALRRKERMLHLFLWHLLDGLLLLLRRDDGTLRDLTLLDVVVGRDIASSERYLLALLKYRLFGHLLVLTALGGAVVVERAYTLHVVVLLAARRLLDIQSGLLVDVLS